METASRDYPHRTKRNVLDSDGTLVLTRGRPAGGTALTIRIAAEHGKPCLVLDLNRPPDAQRARDWGGAHHIRVLNVAGARESEDPGIHEQTIAFLRTLLS
jgi:hypothetical protein